MTNKKELNEMINDMGIMLEEVILPHMMQRNYWDEFKMFGTWGAWECTEDQIRRMNNLVKLYEILSEIDKEELLRLI